MSKEKNLVEDALIQMKNLEEAVAENAKGILASTMKQEIKELVKESIVSEDDDEEIVDEPETGDNDDEDDDFEFPETGDDEDYDFSETGDDDDSDMSDIEMSDDDDDIIDLTGTDSDGNPLISDDDLLQVFASMDPEDGIVVKKDNNMVNLKDDNTDKEYLIRMGESYGDDDEYSETFESYGDDDEYSETFESYGDDDEYSETFESYDKMDIDSIIDSVFSKDVDSTEESDDKEVVYEIEMDEDEMMDEDEGYQMESTKPKIGSGAKIGKPKFSYKKSSGGFKEDMKQGTRGVGMGKPKFEFKEGMKKEKMEGSKLMGKGKPPVMFHSGKKEETKEAARTYGMGSKSGRGLRKGITPNRNLTFENEQRNEEQIQILREKNEEYRKALNVFRDKLNEVAIFNSNLAYATRLFTEHSTSKQEKINILRRFDGVETLKESKNLYRTIKSELSNTTTKPSITESIERNIEKSPSSGSASTLIESKTYENPQFLRMKDIMSKIIK